MPITLLVMQHRIPSVEHGDGVLQLTTECLPGRKPVNTEARIIQRAETGVKLLANGDCSAASRFKKAKLKKCGVGVLSGRVILARIANSKEKTNFRIFQAASGTGTMTMFFCCGVRFNVVTKEI